MNKQQSQESEVCFLLSIRQQPRSKQRRSSAASDVYKRQGSVRGVSGNGYPYRDNLSPKEAR
ncbi:hypothetical protein BS598_24475 [Klebsiella pneumoniae]|nr:hypothetical protein BS598_24475 [Klebsiella pneumoniae]